MALKDKLMTLEDFKAVRDVDVASNSAQFTEIKADLDAQTGIISKTEGYYINLTTDPVDISNPSPSSTGLTYALVDCSEGDKFVINAVGATNGRAWGFLDSSNHVLSMADANVTVTDLELTAPTNAVKLVINDKSGGMIYKVGNNLATKASNGLSDDVKEALLDCFRNVAWVDDSGQLYFNALAQAMGLDDFYNITEWSTDDGMLTSLQGVYTDYFPILKANLVSLSRGFVACNRGKKAIVDYNTGDLLQPARYPIPVPVGATGVTVTLPSDYSFGFTIIRLVNNEYQDSGYGSGWSEYGGGSNSFGNVGAAQENTFMALRIKGTQNISVIGPPNPVKVVFTFNEEG